MLIFVAIILITNVDPHKPEGPIESITGIAMFGSLALIVALAIGFALRGPRSNIAAIVLGALAVITLPFFWSGAPATFGAAAAWRAGFVQGGEPQTGAARGFGIVGIVVAVLVIVGGWAGFGASIISGNY
ncbi:hypothetical protein [Smaragdicoccus niigatensis]|uniref:hypothetical protein n=1 Tax=Smaragdicoccus niigatensis TaxID=359359 RepID=UPI00039A37DC|nr:hypothetical protein [Smaragdicoccus niigatensis]